MLLLLVMALSPTPARRALVVVDVQNDFLPPHGSLAVPGGQEIIPVINGLLEKQRWDLVVLTQDWHPADHVSFARNNPGAEVFQEIALPSGSRQVMWPSHCEQGSNGAEFSSELKRLPGDVVVRKGTNRLIDSYSGFFDNDHQSETDLRRVLQDAAISEVFVVGLALDYCVGWTALDAAAIGFQTTLIRDASRGISQESIEKILAQLAEHSIKVINSDEL